MYFLKSFFFTVSTAKFSSSEVSRDGDATANKMFGSLKVKK